MNRIFSILTAITLVMILIAGGGTYWISQSDVTSAKQRATESLARGLALSISSQIRTLQGSVSKMAASPEVIMAMNSENPILMEETANMLDQFMPNVMKIRLLPATVTELDQRVSPHMGNADLIMAQETLIKPQLPVIQGQGKNRHLAITSVIKKEGVAIGIVLASLNYQFLQPSFKSANLKGGFIELKQGNTNLAKTGNASDKDNSSIDNQIKVAQSPWVIQYWTSNSSNLLSLNIIAGIILVPVLLTCLSFFVSFRKVSALLKADQGSILKAVKDLMTGKSVGSYPVNLIEMKAIITTLVQFKRVLDKDGVDVTAEIETEIDDFFDEPNGMSFLDPVSTIEVGEETADAFENAVKSSPISLPESEQTTSEMNDSSSFSVGTPASSTSKPSIFKAYDIRGIAGKTLTKEIIYDIGRAIGSEAKDKSIKTIVLGRDGRTSSPLFADSLAQGITSTGVNILDIGMVPSPVVYFVAQHTEGKSGVMITGSHNPAEYNGLKVVLDGETLATDKIKQLEQRIEDNNYLTGETGSIDENNMFINEYIGIISEDIRIARPMKVVIDCGNGVAGELAPILFKTIGCEVVELFCDIDGTFPNHHPNPSNPDNMRDLVSAVQHYDADVGIAFDGDGDRLGVVDCKGKIIWPDRLMMLFAKDVLASKPGADVIYDIKCSSHLEKQISKSGGRPTMWKSGHSLIKAKLKETNAILAGEMSGHIFFNDRWFGFDDALYSASRLIEILSADTRNSQQVFADFPESVSTPEIYLELAEGENTGVMEKIMISADFPDGKTISIDGLRVEFPDGWGLVKISNTMPALVLRFEADNNVALSRIQEQFKQLLSQVKPDISFSF